MIEMSDFPFQPQRLALLRHNRFWRILVLAIVLFTGLSLFAPALNATATPVLPSAPPAQDCATDFTGPTLQGFTPKAVSVGITPVTVNLRPTVSDPCGISHWRTEVHEHPMRYYVNADQANPQATFTVPPPSVHPGYTDLLISATDNSAAKNTTQGRFPLLLLRSSTFPTSDLTVENARPLVIRAKLTRANWHRKTYETFPHQRVELQFRAQGSHPSAWKHRGFHDVDEHGVVRATHSTSTNQQASYYGTWRLHYLGNEFTNSTTSAEVAIGPNSSGSGPKVTTLAPGNTPEGAVPDDNYPHALREVSTTTPNAAISAEKPLKMNPAGPPTTCEAPIEITGIYLMYNIYDAGTPAVGLGTRRIRIQPTATELWCLNGWSVNFTRNGYQFGTTGTDVYDNPFLTLSVPRWNSIAGYGTMTSIAQAGQNPANTTRGQFPLRLVRQSTWPANSLHLQVGQHGAAPVQLTGTLQWADWENWRYVNASHARVALEFRPQGSTTWHHRRMATTNAQGLVVAKEWNLTPQQARGQWRLTYRGGELFSRTSSTPLTW